MRKVRFPVEGRPSCAVTGQTLALFHTVVVQTGFLFPVFPSPFAYISAVYLYFSCTSDT